MYNCKNIDNPPHLIIDATLPCEVEHCMITKL